MPTLENNPFYCKSLTNYNRRKTRIVQIGDVALGGNNPVRLQSMTNTKTLDTLATVEQSIRLIEAGSEYVRITAPGIKDAENLANIKSELKKRGYKVPLIADIHFNPKAAEIAAKYVEKVRINPGNFVDKKVFKTVNYSETEYQDEIHKIRESLIPLLNICKEHETALRIGTNHGSLSDRIMSKYGDTPLGMVESAMEFLRICEEENYQNIVLSMKASNTRVMIQAYRLLVSKMEIEGMNYPLHLGVTEAGEGEDGRIKSATGIGALLADGLGDTIRVSLTEDPEIEIPVAQKIAQYFNNYGISKSFEEIETPFYNPYQFNKRVSSIDQFEDSTKTPIVIQSGEGMSTENSSELIPEYIVKNNELVSTQNKMKHRVLSSHEFLSIKQTEKINFVQLNINDLSKELLDKLKTAPGLFLIFKSTDRFLPEARLFFNVLNKEKIKNPIILYKKYNESNLEEYQVKASSDFGSVFSDGFGDGIWIENENLPANESLKIAFGILQACRLRVSKTEYISCPSCGRTLFGLQDTTAKIREQTAHLKGLKIGIMGCIVNGPGEMADADYGYVGSGPGKISLYKGQEVVKKNIPTENAVNELMDIIKENGDWKEKG